MGWHYFEFSQSLPIVDSYLVWGWKGFYERLVIMFLHLETLIDEWLMDDSRSSALNSQTNIKQNSYHSHKSSKVFVKPGNENLDSFKIDSIREYFNSSSVNMQDMLVSGKEDLKFETLIEIVEEFNKAYMISITDEDLKRFRKQAIKFVADNSTDLPTIKEFNQTEFSKI